MRCKVVVLMLGLLLCICCLLPRDARGGDEEEPAWTPGDAKQCFECHEEAYKAFFSSAHGAAMDPRTPAGKQNCDACHGDSEIHVKSEGKKLGKILSFGSKTPAEKKNEVCLGCHANKGKQAFWQGSTHETRGVSCVNCHSNHGGNPKLLAKPTEPESCAQCHKRVKADLLRVSHHPIREGKITCTDCHNPHGTVTDKLISANSVNEKCYECHAEKRGPFLWEHSPVRENCLNCHKPHGSPHEKLLSAKKPYLCQRCHSNSGHPGSLYSLNTTSTATEEDIFSALSSRIFYRACNNCHNQAHGSNHPSGRSLAR